MPDGTCSIDGCARRAVYRRLCRRHDRSEKVYGDPLYVDRPASLAIDRFLDRIEIAENGCWLWTGVVINVGYGVFVAPGTRRPKGAHRWSYEFFIGPIPAGMHIDHMCHNADPTCLGQNNVCAHRACVNPDHLRAATPRENTLAGKTITAANAIKTHCPQGHPYDEANTYRNPTGGRMCRTCMRISSRAWRLSIRRAGS